MTSAFAGDGSGAHTGSMRHTEFWARMDEHLGSRYARSWAQDQHIADLDGRTVMQALEAGVPPKQVWRAVCTALQLPARDR